jgi:hypothetical protein
VTWQGLATACGLVLRGLAAYLASVVLTFVFLVMSVPIMREPDPPGFAARLFGVFWAGLGAALGGWLTFRIGRAAAWPAGIAVALSFALPGGWSLVTVEYERDLGSVLALFVVPAVFLLGVAVASRIARAGREAQFDRALDLVIRRLGAWLLALVLIGVVMFLFAVAVFGGGP